MVFINLAASFYLLSPQILFSPTAWGRYLMKWKPLKPPNFTGGAGCTLYSEWLLKNFSVFGRRYFLNTPDDTISACSFHLLQSALGAAGRLNKIHWKISICKQILAHREMVERQVGQNKGCLQSNSSFPTWFWISFSSPRTKIRAYIHQGQVPSSYALVPWNGNKGFSKHSTSRAG